MTKRFFITLAVALLGFIATKAQAPFTGTVEYHLLVGDREAAPPNFIVLYNKQYILLEAKMPDKQGQMVEENLVIDFITGNTYEISHKKKSIRQKYFNVSEANQIQLTDTPFNSGKIANIPSKAYKAKIAEETSCTIWLADSLPLAVPANLKKTNDLFMWATDRLMLKIEVPGTDSFSNPFSISAISIKPDTASNKPFQLPKGYSFTDEKILAKAQDSLLKAFKTIDSNLIRQRFNEDSAKWFADEANSYVNKKPPSPKKPQKKAPAKGNKPLARRPKQ